MFPLLRSAERELAKHGKSSRDVLAVRTADGAFCGSWEDFGGSSVRAHDLVIVGDGWWLERGPFVSWRFMTPPLPIVSPAPLAGAIDRPEWTRGLTPVYLPNERDGGGDPELLRPGTRGMLRWRGPYEGRFLLESFMVPPASGPVSARIYLGGWRILLTETVPWAVLEGGAVVSIGEPVLVASPGNPDSDLGVELVVPIDAPAPVRPCVVLFGRELGPDDGAEVGRLIREARRRRG